MAHFILVSLIAVGGISAFIVAMLIVGAAMAAHASVWFSDAKRGRPVPPQRTLETELPPHSTPVSAT